MSELAALLQHAVRKKDLRILEGVCCTMNYREIRGLAESAGLDLDELEELLTQIS